MSDLESKVLKEFRKKFQVIKMPKKATDGSQRYIGVGYDDADKLEAFLKKVIKEAYKKGLEEGLKNRK